jgi:predicted metal-dependent hydrolase
VVQKDIKNVHLSVYPPNGRVRLSAPLRMSVETIRVFAASKIGWIKKQQAKLKGQEQEPPREYLDRESHYVWGKRYLLKVVEDEVAPSVEVQAGLYVCVSAQAPAKRQERRPSQAGIANYSRQRFRCLLKRGGQGSTSR